MSFDQTLLESLLFQLLLNSHQDFSGLIACILSAVNMHMDVRPYVGTGKPLRAHVWRKWALPSLSSHQVSIPWETLWVPPPSIYIKIMTDLNWVGLEPAAGATVRSCVQLSCPLSYLQGWFADALCCPVHNLHDPKPCVFHLELNDPPSLLLWVSVSAAIWWGLRTMQLVSTQIRIWKR